MVTKKVIKKPAPKKAAVPTKKAPVAAKKVVKAPVAVPIKKEVPAKVAPAIPTKSAAIHAPKMKVIAKSGKVQTAEGWKRMMVNKLGKKRPGKSLV